MNNGFFSSMAPMNKAAFACFGLAKIFGFVGVVLGFGDVSTHALGGYFLVLAFVMIGVSVTFALVQSARDKKKFEQEDLLTSRTRKLASMKIELEEEVRQLQEQRKALQSLAIRK